VTDQASGSITVFQATTGTTVATLTLASPLGLAFDGVNMWVVNAGAASVTRL